MRYTMSNAQDPQGEDGEMAIGYDITWPVDSSRAILLPK